MKNEIEHSIRELIPPDFLPVYGTCLTPTSFRELRKGEVVDDWQSAREGWAVEALGEDGAPTTYFILLENVCSELAETGGSPERASICLALPGHGHCSGKATDGAPPLVLNDWEHPMLHPYRKSYRKPAPVADWVSAIMNADATGRQARQGGKDGGDEFEAVGKRLKFDIVDCADCANCADCEVSTASFFDFEGLRSWLETALERTQLRVELATIKHYEFSSSGRLREGMLLRMLCDDEPYGCVPVPVSTSAPLEGWFEGGSYPRNASSIVPVLIAKVSLSGSQIVSSNARYALSWVKLCKEAVLERDEPWQSIRVSEAGFRDDWLVLHIVGTDIALPIPRAHAHLAVHVDGDSSQVFFRVHPSAERAVHHRRRDIFQRRWGKWLDDHSALSDEELIDGCVRAEGALRRLLEEGGE